MEEDNTLIMVEPFTEEEKEEMKQQLEKNLRWAYSLSDEQITFLCDGGWYNDTMRGYLISAARRMDFTEEQIKRLLQGLRQALDGIDKKEADELYANYVSP